MSTVFSLNPDMQAIAALGLLVLILVAGGVALRGHFRRLAVDAGRLEHAVRLQAQVEALQGQSDGQVQAIEHWRQQAQQAELALARAQAALDEKQAALQVMQAGFEAARASLRVEFEQLASQVLEEKSRRFAESGRSELTHVLLPFREQVEQFRQRINEVHEAAVRGQARLSADIGQVREMGLKMSAEAQALSSALRGDKKTAGNWGEMQLERSLQVAGLVRDEHYRSQASLRDESGQRRLPDFLVLLPDGKHMVLDSKVSLVAWEQAVAAETPEARNQALAAHVQAVRQHVADLAGKDYARLIGLRSPGFVLMFMPVEPAYIEALRHDKALFDWAYRQNVVLVSHTTLMPILRTVASLWMLARSNEQARALSDMAGDVYRQVVRVAERLQKLGQTLGSAVGHYNRAVTAVAGQQGLYGKVNRFSDLSIRAGAEMPDLAGLHADIEVHRLTEILPDGAAEPAPSGVQPESVRQESVQPESVQPESVRQESVRSDSARSGSVSDEHRVGAHMGPGSGPTPGPEVLS